MANPVAVPTATRYCARLWIITGLELDGDTVVPVGAVDDGERRYAVYRCR